MIKLLEAIHIEKPKPKDPEMKVGQQAGYLSRSEVDPETGTSHTFLTPEPPLIQMARAIDKSIKELKFYLALPNTEDNKDIIMSAASIITSLRNAVGKLRSLQKTIEGIQKLKGGK